MANNTLARIIALVAAVFVGKPCSADDGQMKSKGVAKVLAVIQQLQTLASETETSKSFEREKVARALSSIQDAEVLGKLAVVSRIIADPGRAEDASYDRWFHQAFLECIYRLRDIDDPKATNVLTEMANVINLDGGDSLTLKEALKARKERLQPK